MGHSSSPALTHFGGVVLTVMKHPARGRAAKPSAIDGHALCIGHCVGLAVLRQGLLQSFIKEQENSSLRPKDLPRPLHAAGKQGTETFFHPTIISIGLKTSLVCTDCSGIPWGGSHRSHPPVGKQHRSGDADLVLPKQHPSDLPSSSWPFYFIALSIFHTHTLK